MAASVVASVALPISNNFSFAPSMDAYGKLSEYGKLGAWSPLSLFAASEVGAWFDPSDLSTMFQDRAGTTPVTADGQTVGLILDKSKGMVLGPEIITNGTFDSASGWTINTGWGISGGTANFSSSAPGDIQWNYSIVAGKTYQIEFDIVSKTGIAYIQATLGNAESSGPISTTGRKRTIITAAASRAFFTIYVSVSGAATVVIDNVTVKELPGNHAVAPSDAARPLKTSTGASDWTNYDAVDDALNTTFPSSLGSSCTVCRANVGAAPTILTAQTIGTSYADSTDNAGLIIINRALTGQETTDVTAWLTAKGAT